MKRRWSVLVAVAAIALAVGAIGPSRAAADDSVSTAWAGARSCAANQGGLQVLILVDESISLQKNDPEGRRRELVKSWLDDLMAEEAKGIDVRLAMAGYGSQIVPIFDWQDLTSESYYSAAVAASQLPADQWDTDHSLAIAHAAQTLSAEGARVTGQGQQPCLTLLWFTDGEYDFENFTIAERERRQLPTSVPYSPLPLTPENETAIIRDGLTSACAPSGPVLTLRNQNASIVAIALDATGSVDFRVVDEMSTGNGYPDGANEPCELPSYLGGGFQEGADPVTATTIVPPVTTVETETSEADPGEQSFPFDVPSLATRFRLEIGSDTTVEQLTLTDPSGLSFALDVAAGGAQTSDGGYVIDVARGTDSSLVVGLRDDDGDSLAGGWTVTAATAEPAQLEVRPRYFADLRPTVTTSTRLVAGDAATVQLTVIDINGKPVGQDVAQRLTLTAAIGGSQSESSTPITPNDDGTFSLAIPAAASDGSTDRLSFVVSTAADEPVIIEDALLDFKLDRQEYPSVDFGVDDFEVVRKATITTPGVVSIPYRLVGPAVGTGCVIDPQLKEPFGAESSATVAFATDEQSCLAQGTSEERGLTVTIDGRRFGTFCERFVFELTSDASADVRTTEQSICISTEKSATALTRVLAILLTVMLSLAPFVLLALLNRLNARLPRTREVKLAATHARIRDGGLDLAATGGSLFDYDDFLGEGIRHRSRWRLELTDIPLVIESRAITRLTVEGYGRPSPTMLFTGPQRFARPTGRPIVIGQGDQILFAGSFEAPIRLPTSLDAVWVLHAPDQLSLSSDEPVRVDLYTLKVMTTVGPRADVLADKIRSALTGAVLANLARQEEVLNDSGGIGV